MNAIEIKNLKFKYEENGPFVLDGLSLSLNKGEYVSIIGHNGSGKSTLAKLIIGLLEKESGEIKIFGQDLNIDTVKDIRYKVGIVFQNPDNQFIGATVRDDIAFGLENHCVEHDKMEDIITSFAKKVNMEEFLDKEPSSLSGGQKQRVAIAGVLAMQPEIIISFFPRGSSIAVASSKIIIELVHKLKKENENLTILSITHDQEEANISDRVIVINEGKVIYNDIPSVVFSHQEELEKMGLEIPFFDKLKQLLINENIDVKDCNNLLEVKNKLCQ